ncbi:phage integrase family protein [Calothrix sp. NIES-4071]|nr:phage integrase family protein [Calothrix sp. NIES-4071]BAZ58748.1 phage integrase family protein [Calothrix sp. NIES-4105]
MYLLSAPKNKERQMYAISQETLRKKNYLKESGSKYTAGNNKPQPDTSIIPMTLKEVWFEFIEYKLESKQICQTTYIIRYKRTYTYFLMPFFDRELSDELAEDILLTIKNKTSNMRNMKRLLSCLSHACERLIKQGKLKKNYFLDLQESIILPRKPLHSYDDDEDRRAFTREERDKIIAAFYSSTIKGEKQAGALVEFLFLTGCRLGEAFALKWEDIESDLIWFDESYSTETKITKSTKTNTARPFKRKGLNRLNTLLERIRPTNFSPEEYVFTTVTGKQYTRLKLSSVWLGIDKSKKCNSYYYPGIVSKLVKSNEIKQYLKPSSTRHTFITIQIRNGADPMLLAECCGNGLDIIYQYYLDKYDPTTELMDV